MRSKAPSKPSLDDMARLAGEALRFLGGARGQMRGLVTRLMEDMDFVTREEFERVEALAERARERQAELEKRLAALEKKKPTARRKRA